VRAFPVIIRVPDCGIETGAFVQTDVTINARPIAQSCSRQDPSGVVIDEIDPQFHRPAQHRDSLGAVARFPPDPFPCQSHGAEPETAHGQVAGYRKTWVQFASFPNYAFPLSRRRELRRRPVRLST
jgi:hypothetical protein